MKKDVVDLIRNNTETGSKITDVEFNRLLAELDIILPDDYMEFLNIFNGCEGVLTESIYLQLWSLNDLKCNNEMYEVMEFAPELLLIGTDGGDTAFAINREDLSFVEVPFIGMSLTDAAFLGNNFVEFIENLIEKRNSCNE
jgi:hypothetical protein